MKLVSKRVLLTLPLAVLIALPAVAQDLRSVDSRVKRLERDMMDLQRSYYGGAVAPSTAPSAGQGYPDASAGQLAIRLDGLENEIRRLTGSIERLDYRLRRIEQGGAEQGGDLADAATGGAALDRAVPATDQNYATSAGGAAADDNRAGTVGTLGTLNSTGNSTGAASASQAGGNQVAALASPQDTDGQYLAARNQLAARNFDGAGQGFTQFLDANPDHRFAPDAHYWLGESYYMRGLYEDAANAYLNGYRTFPDSEKAPDSLLKLGMTLAALDQADEACLTYQEVLASYPGASAQVRRRVAIEQKRASC